MIEVGTHFRQLTTKIEGFGKLFITALYDVVTKKLKILANSICLTYNFALKWSFIKSDAHQINFYNFNS